MNMIQGLLLLVVLFFGLTVFGTSGQQLGIILIITGAVMDMARPYFSTLPQDYIGIHETFRIRFRKFLILFSLAEMVMLAGLVIFLLELVFEKQK